jgi:hypothetical protein
VSGGDLLHVVQEVLQATIPVLALILFFQLVVLRQVPPDLRKMLIGAGIAIVGFFLFMLGAQLSLIPMGRAIGEVMAGTPLAVLLPFAFVLGIATIYAEPAVRIMAEQVEAVSSGSIRSGFILPVMAAGVGVALVLAMLRIYGEFSLSAIMIPGLIIMMLLTLMAPRSFVPIAYDSGAVATGPVAVNFVLPLATGVAMSMGREGLIGFGVVGIISMTPIISMLLLGIVLRRRTSRD